MRKNILWADTATGEVVSRAKSPKKGTIYNLLPELYALRELLQDPNLSFIAVLVNCDEYRYADGFGKDKKKRATKVDIIPTEFIDEIFFETVENYMIFLPETLPETFTSSDYAKATKLRLAEAQKALLVLTDLGVVKRIGNKGRNILYSIMEEKTQATITLLNELAKGEVSANENGYVELAEVEFLFAESEK